jgi:hypothetical protein
MNILQVIFTAMIGGNLVLTTFVDISLMRIRRCVFGEVVWRDQPVH